MSNLKNLVPCCINVFKQKPDNEGYYVEPTKNQMIDKLLEQHDKLTKYKRVFEILKDKLAIEPMKDEKECWFYFKNVYSNGYTDYVDLNNDEYELLEELMKGEASI